MAPSTFASAAAGTSSAQNAPRESAPDWSRRTNGATQTFRRPSGATANPPPALHNDSLPSQPPRYVPPHRNGTLPDNRYSKDQMLDLFRAQQTMDGGLSDELPNLYVGGWQPDLANGASSAGWGRAEHTRDVQPGPEACWDRDGLVEPLALQDMDDVERELFLTSVNTPIKPPSQNKDGQQTNGFSGRKLSISNSTTPGGFGLPSPSVARGGGRRRETSESYPFPQNDVSSPGTFTRNDQRTGSPPPSLLRRRTEMKESNKPEDKEVEDKGSSVPFGSLRRNPNAPLSAGFAAPSSPWANIGPQSAGITPMGSFGNFGLGGSIGQPVPPSQQRPGLGGGRSESRFKNILSKDIGEEVPQRTIERKTSISSLSRVNENESWRPQDRAEPLNDPLDEAEEDMPSGSAALAADADISPPHQRQGFGGFGTPSRQGTQDEFGFGAFGMTTDNAHGFGPGYHPGRDAFQQTPAHQQRVGQSINGNNGPMSPTDTNPYQSPEQHVVDRMAEDDNSKSHLPGLGQFGMDPSQHQQLGELGGISVLPNLGRGPGPASDRSQTSSVGPNRGFSSLGGLGQLGHGPGSVAWPGSQGGLGTPGRQTAGLSNAFGGGIFSNNMSDMQSPGLAGLGGNSILSPPGGAYGGSRMASMFPTQMQDQMRHGENERDSNNERGVPQGFGGLGDMGRGAEGQFAHQGFPQDKGPQHAGEGPFGAPGQQSQDTLQAHGQPQLPGSSASNQPPAPQQRTMVMPDRMRWIYKDPQGHTQGPWSGLEMHDWYKAGFFSPELLVKKYEDIDYEPLAQLIRRIGNSREPFLVPQIGIPHGAPSSTGPSAWAGSAAVPAPGAATAAGAQPPFASSFPSFGTTLTADQQNALERRKQEEQYLMARQKEHLAQAQIAQRMQMQGGGHAGINPGQLQHHSSAHSLQSQPSFGSITSPAAYQPSPIQGATTSAPSTHHQGFFDNSFRQLPQGGLGAIGAGVDSLRNIPEEDVPGLMDRLNLGGNRQAPGQFGAPGQPFGGQQTQHTPQEARDSSVQQMHQDRARLQQEQAEHDARQPGNDEQPSSYERLQQFQQLQGSGQSMDHFETYLEKPIAPPQQPQAKDVSASQNVMQLPPALTARQSQHEQLSLTEQVQKAASAKHSPAPQQPGLPQPFPPAPSGSPLPAPAAQRTGRQSVADQLQTESRDQSQTPSVDTPSVAIAPWAKEPAEALRGPSLKEIQEAEAKKAAEAEETAAAARRAAFQKEMEVQAAAAAATIPAPGLPTSSTWGASSPATPTGSMPAAWANKTVQKPTGPTSSKTLAQIQKEEEGRKRRVAAAAAVAQAQANVMSGVPAPAGSKSYANLAGKIISPPPGGNIAGSAWTTVGASGKVRTPAPGATPAANRTVSTGVVPTVQPSIARKAPVRSTTMSNSGPANAQDEFRKWAVNELRPDLNKGINVDEFVATLVFLPSDTEIITEAVHGVSSTIDSRHFAEEFVRRKRLADKGLIEATIAKSGSPSHAARESAGGWSEVAKKGPAKDAAAAAAKEEANGNGFFKVVPSKKKGGKR